MEIRKLTSEDAEDYRRLMLQAFEKLPVVFVESLQEGLDPANSQLAVRIRDIGQADNQVFGAFSDAGELIGAVGVQQERLLKWRHKGVIFGMYVAQSHQGRGIGRKLLEAVLTGAGEMTGLEQLILVVGEQTPGAQRLYESFRFRPFGVEPRELKVGDRYYRGIHMWLKLR